MNKRQTKRIMKLLDDGLSIFDVVRIMIELSRDSYKAAEVITDNFVLRIKPPEVKR